MDLTELNFVKLGEQDLDIELFDCGRGKRWSFTNKIESVAFL